jgi:hypothetical protein
MCMVCAWSAHDLFMVCAWFGLWFVKVHGGYWSVLCLCMVCAMVHCLCFVSAWFVHGMCMVCLWFVKVHGLCRFCAWHVYDYVHYLWNMYLWSVHSICVSRACFYMIYTWSVRGIFLLRSQKINLLVFSDFNWHTESQRSRRNRNQNLFWRSRFYIYEGYFYEWKCTEYSKLEFLFYSEYLSVWQWKLFFSDPFDYYFVI